ncbi:hypothetical protein [Rhodococcus pyridinivorans]|uniref:hypothetical protein n=1 Tax=Rhodococcus pyridinivorans TaxID=103816 RepID=UPI002658E6FE|nr:hypothetical protein [Rhodococcus pyridinivorans]
MAVFGMTSVVGIESSAAAVNAIAGQIGAVHEAVNAVASAILPPTQDSASALATVRQITNVNDFSAMLRLGLAEQMAVADTVRGAAATMAASDGVNAALATSIPS